MAKAWKQRITREATKVRAAVTGLAQALGPPAGTPTYGEVWSNTEPRLLAQVPAGAHCLVPESTGDLESGTRALALSPSNCVILSESLPIPRLRHH